MSDPILAAPAATADPAASAPAPIESAVIAEPAPATLDGPTEPASEPAQTDEGKVSPKIVEELKTQRRKKQKAEMEAAYWRGRYESTGGKPPEPASAPAQHEPGVPAPLVAPKLDQFETYEQYEAAKDEYLVKKAKQEVIIEYVQNEQRKAAAAVEEKFQKTIEKAAKDDPAIIDILRDPSLPVSVNMIPVLKESEVAPQLLRWLDQNREEARRIASLSPLLAARELGIVEARITYAPKPEPPKTVSSAPEPIKPVAPTTPAIVDEDNLTMEEYHKRRTEQLLGRR